MRLRACNVFERAHLLYMCPCALFLHFLTQLCLGDLFSDKYSPCEDWPVMICHVSGRVKGGEERRRNNNNNKKKGTINI